jgi:hypothetical protein
MKIPVPEIESLVMLDFGSMQQHFCYRQMGEKFLDFLNTPRLKMSLVMIKNVSDNPVYLTLFGNPAVRKLQQT